MSDTPIADAVENAVSAEMQKVGSMLTGFVCIAATLNEDGTTGLTITRPGDQATHVSLGMLAYGEEWFKDDVRYQINTMCAEDDE